MKKSKTLKSTVFILLFVAVALPLILCGGIAKENKVFAAEDVEFIQVDSLETLDQQIKAGKTNFEITQTVQIDTAKTYIGLTFKYTQSDTDKLMFNIAEGGSLTLLNCNVVGESKWTFNTENQGEVTAPDEKISKQRFVSGNGNLTLKNCEMKDMWINATFIGITGSAENQLEVNINHCKFEHIAILGAFVYTSHADQNWGDEFSTYGDNTIINFWGRNNGSFIQSHYATVNIYQFNAQNIVHNANGFIAPENASTLNVYNCDIRNFEGYSNGGTFGSLFHMYDGCTFNMYGGSIKKSFGAQGLICTGRDNINFNIYGGEISCAENTICLVLESANLYIGEDAVCEGNINCWGYGSVSNRGTIIGDIVMMDNDPVFGMTGEPALQNNGKIDGKITLSVGNITNNGQIDGEIDINGGELVNSEKGIINADVKAESGRFENNGYVEGTVDIAAEAIAENNGKIAGSVSGTVNGEGVIQKRPDQKSQSKNNEKVPAWAIVLIVFDCLFTLAFIACLVGYLVKRKNNKVAD